MNPLPQEKDGNENLIINYSTYIRAHPQIKRHYRIIVWPLIIRSLLPISGFQLYASLSSLETYPPLKFMPIVMTLALPITCFAYKALPAYTQATALEANKLIAPQDSLPTDKQVFTSALKTLSNMHDTLKYVNPTTKKRPANQTFRIYATEAMMLASLITSFFSPWTILLAIFFSLTSSAIFDAIHQTLILKLIANKTIKEKNVTNYPRQDTVKSQDFTKPPSL